MGLLNAKSEQWREQNTHLDELALKILGENAYKHAQEPGFLKNIRSRFLSGRSTVINNLYRRAPREHWESTHLSDLTSDVSSHIADSDISEGDMDWLQGKPRVVHTYLDEVYELGRRVADDIVKTSLFLIIRTVLTLREQIDPTIHYEIMRRMFNESYSKLLDYGTKEGSIFGLPEPSSSYTASAIGIGYGTNKTITILTIPRTHKE